MYHFLLLTFLLTLSQASAEESYEFKGNHFIASFLKCDREAIDDSHKIAEVMEKAIHKTGAQILSENSYFFMPNGMTQVFLLSESHASIHTYPEHRACFVDLFTCGDHCDWKPYFEHLKDYFKSEEFSILLLERTEDVKIVVPKIPD